MQYFIYPKGVNGKLLGEIIEFFEPDSSVSFIDDSDPDCSLDTLKDRIGEAQILLASKKHKKKLIENLRRVGAENFCDGIELFGAKNSQYAKSKLKNPKRAVGIYLSGFANEKHIGTLDMELKNRGVEVLYIAKDKDALLTNIERIGENPAIICWHDFLGELREVAIFVSTNGGRAHDSVKTINLGHSLVHLPELHYHFPDALEYKSMIRDWYFNMNDYLVVSNEIDYAIIGKLSKRYERKTEILRFGYLGFEEIFEDDDKTPLQSVLLAPKKVLCEESYYAMISEILSKTDLNVILRYHKDDRGELIEDEAERRFSSSGRFFIDREPKLKNSLKAQCVSVITDFSTFAYSFPLSLFRPVILFGMTWEPSVEGIEFANENLHIKTHLAHEVVEALRDISENRTLYMTRIKQYKDSILYPYKDASKELAEKIIEILDKEN
ncbi:MAG: hypothetical protein ACTTJS_03640 [Wolinella sp.]